MDIIKRYIYLNLGIYGSRICPTLKNRYST